MIYDNLSEDELIEVVKTFGWQKIYGMLKTYKICLEAVNQNGGALEYVPMEFMTEEVYTTAINTDGYALEYVPEEFKTFELCLAAIKNNEDAFGFIPNDMRKSDEFKRALIDNGLYNLLENTK